VGVVVGCVVVGVVVAGAVVAAGAIVATGGVVVAAAGIAALCGDEMPIAIPVAAAATASRPNTRGNGTPARCAPERGGIVGRL